MNVGASNSDCSRVTDGDCASPLAQLPDAQVFSQDPTSYTKDDLAVVVERLQKIVAKMRRARQDDAVVAAEIEKAKNANKKSKKPKKGKKSISVSDDPLEGVV